MNLDSILFQHRLRLERKLHKILGTAEYVEPVIAEVMHYAVLGGGKRLRPMLAFASAQALGADPRQADIPACALELIHTYSLVHDDLPAMDDDVLRRGRPTCHIRFDEASAILAGDALQSLAFNLLSAERMMAVSHKVQLQMIQCLSRAAGAVGMVAGQQFDISVAGKTASLDFLEKMHRLKTGALIRASVELGALSTNISTKEQRAVLGNYAEKIGLAFQVHDDILDATQDSQTLGKTSGRDELLNKPTYVGLLGVDGAQKKCEELIESAIGELDGLPSPELLVGLARYINSRNH